MSLGYWVIDIIRWWVPAAIGREFGYWYEIPIYLGSPRWNSPLSGTAIRWPFLLHQKSGDRGDLFLPSPRPSDTKIWSQTRKTFINHFLSAFFERMLETTSIQQIFLIPGNWDLGYPSLSGNNGKDRRPQSGKLSTRKTDTNSIGYPFVPPTPFRPKDYEKMDDREAPGLLRRTLLIFNLRSGRWIDSHRSLSLSKRRETIEEDLDRLPKTSASEKSDLCDAFPSFRDSIRPHPGRKTCRKSIHQNLHWKESAPSDSSWAYPWGSRSLRCLHGSDWRNSFRQSRTMDRDNQRHFQASRGHLRNGKARTNTYPQLFSEMKKLGHTTLRDMT